VPFTLVVLACHADGYGNLCEFITRLRRASEKKGTYRLRLSDIDPPALADCLVLVSPERRGSSAQLLAVARWMLGNFMGRCWIAVELLRQFDDEMWLHRLREVSELTAIPLVAPATCTCTCARASHCRMCSRPRASASPWPSAAGPAAQCRAAPALAPAAGPDLSGRAAGRDAEVAARCGFSLDELRYQYPDEVVPAGETPAGYLRRITYEGPAGAGRMASRPRCSTRSSMSWP
jgi:error-prone DNA polymerase